MLNSTADPRYKLLSVLGHEEEEMHAFATALRRSKAPSVDLFLERRRDFLELGKRALVTCLMPKEEPNLIDSPKSSDDWFGFLFEQMNARRDVFGQNAISFITFNYDRSLEQLLWTTMSNLLNLREDDWREIMESFPLVHVYGQLGRYPVLGDTARPYGAPLSPDSVIRCADAIRVLNEDTIDDSLFRSAIDLMRNAEVVCFLGFGYHESNLKRLKLYDLPDEVKIVGSALDMSNSLRTRALRAAGRGIEFGQATLNSNDYLNNSAVLE
jgi:hypothetical protein